MSERERWAYEELQVGDAIQEGDQWLNPDGRWQAIVVSVGSTAEVWCARVRRPHNITMMLAAFADQAEVLAEVRADEKRLFDDSELLRSEYAKLQRERDEACRERDLARAEIARLSTELWARKPLEDRVASLTHELANAREDIQKLVKTIAENADQFADHTKFLVQERDEARAEVERLSAALKTAQRARDELQRQVDELRAGLMGLVSAQHVHSMLEDMLDQTEWVGQCLDSSTYEQMSCIQRTISVIAERVSDMGKEVASADA